MPTIREVVLHSGTDKITTETLCCSPDLLSIAIIKTTGTEQAVTWQATTGNSFYYVPVIAWKPRYKVALELHGSADDGSWLLGLSGTKGTTQGLVFSPNSKRLAYVGAFIDKSGEGASVVFDGIKGKLWDDISGLPFAPKSSVCAYVSKTKDDKYVVVVGEKESIEYDGVLNARVYWSPRGDDYAYVAGRKIATGMEAVLVRNGVEQAKGKTFRAVSYSPDGERFAYGVVTSDQKGIVKAYMVLDGTTSRPYDGLGEDSFFSPNSKRFAYVVASTSKSG